MDQIMLTIPPKAEYIMVVRLTLSGIAARAGFDFETIEDLKMAISEVFNLFEIEKLKGKISVEFNIASEYLDIRIDVPNGEPTDNELAKMILQTLIDEVEFEKTEDGHRVKLKKYHRGV
ncbi:ATP-binding protein [Anaerocellum danielii]|uniref:Anti-sigma regulatory factor n=1 Tax=Anaerocellum danielii TaxID=1387557 RepID=A0ABZ0U0D4_9FIRM|nr:anti-sigma regulatory factor [Caldicellulosiruptor danielii]WPX09188.1 anti-sigma regulatory factor [Caldicellulosiruptor danielii]